VFGPDGSVLRRRTLSGFGSPTIGHVEMVARLAFEAAVRGGHIELSDVSSALAELLDLAGLSQLLSSGPSRATGRQS
jgi:hypothetical protein